MNNVIEWTAYNNNKIVATTYKEKSLKQAIVAARNYLEKELGGEGTIRIYKNGDLVRVDKKTLRTQYETFKPKIINVPNTKWWNS